MDEVEWNEIPVGFTNDAGINTEGSTLRDGYRDVEWMGEGKKQTPLHVLTLSSNYNPSFFTAV